jgi:hypothetical protein
MKANEKKSNDGTGKAFTDAQSSLDQAKNKRLKSQKDSDKLNPDVANNPTNRNHKTDVSKKKTGGGKQSSPGD